MSNSVNKCNGFIQIGGILSNKVSGCNGNFSISKRQVMRTTWIASKRRKRSSDGFRYNRYQK